MVGSEELAHDLHTACAARSLHVVRCMLPAACRLLYAASLHVMSIGRRGPARPMIMPPKPTSSVVRPCTGTAAPVVACKVESTVDGSPNPPVRPNQCDPKHTPTASRDSSGVSNAHRAVLPRTTLPVCLLPSSAPCQAGPLPSVMRSSLTLYVVCRTPCFVCRMPRGTVPYQTGRHPRSCPRT